MQHKYGIGLMYCVFLVVLAACANPRMDDPNYRRAYQECDYEAARAAAGGRTMADRVGDRVDLRNRCLALKGY